MSKAELRYEFEDKPESGTSMVVADGAHWLRMPLPFALNHINLWLLRDGHGWAAVDTGLGDETTKVHWRGIFDTTLAGEPLTRVVVTHMHPDHVGCAGFLTRQFAVPLFMTREEYLLCRVLVADTGRDVPEEGQAFYHAAGWPEAALGRYRKMFGYFGRYVAPLPESYRRLVDSRQLSVDGSNWEVVIGRGHSPEHACLFNAERGLFIGGDQLLPAISANVSVFPTEPTANPLADWFETLSSIRQRIPADVLVLPAHGRPYRGAHVRIDELLADHRARLDSLLEYCAVPRRVVDAFPALYRREISDDNLTFATGEAIAHLNYLEALGEITSAPDPDGIRWYRRA
jgi:glyoxylase-like metal-dependent hydrolase (beta-lactamase superfamily II)